MNTNQLKYFVAVAETKSFTKAANQYYISQTAITQQIHSLEEAMEVQLFDRTCRPIELTPAGHVFLNEAKAILERMNTAVSKVQDASTGLVGTLRVGYTKGYERSSLSNHLRAFHLEYPNILITCYRCDTDKLASGLFIGDYDIIFTWDSTNIMQESNVEYRLVDHSPLVVALFGSHPFARRTSLRREELLNESILYMTPSGTADSFGDNHFMELYKKAGYYPNILFRSNDIESILMMVAAEEGISILPSYVTNKLTNADNLVFVPLIGEGEFEEIIAVWKKGEQGLPLRHFVERIFS
ncbi:MAG: LysR family transcriptional regulator [Lachnospiraceae bacterium]|nr:LysR family transcriptional regulator [Lachnospiraceae bacterium]